MSSVSLLLSYFLNVAPQIFMKEKCFMVGSQDNFIEEEQPLCGMLFSKNKIKIAAHPFLSHASSPMKHSFLMTDISSPVVFST